MASGMKSGRAPLGMKISKVLLIVLLVPVFALAVLDLVRAWKTKSLLSSAAGEAARIAVSTPLAAHTCTDPTPDHPPCSIEAAANAAKRHLMSSGLIQASCIKPNTASFSGILVWVFSCDGNDSCSPKNDSVCLTIDMTALGVERNGTLSSNTRVTLLYPQSWALGSLLEHLPGGSKIPFPKSVAGSALMGE